MDRLVANHELAQSKMYFMPIRNVNDKWHGGCNRCHRELFFIDSCVGDGEWLQTLSDWDSFVALHLEKEHLFIYKRIAKDIKKDAHILEFRTFLQALTI